jgi:hypothetical protein
MGFDLEPGFLKIKIELYEKKRSVFHNLVGWASPGRLR